MKASVAVTTAALLALPTGVTLAACTSEFCATGSRECPNGSYGANLDGGPDGSAGSGGGGAGGSSGSTGGALTGGVGAGGGSGAAGAGAAGGTGGSSAGVGGDGGQGTCDVTGSPATTACLIDDGFAVFVAPGGNGEGTMEAPVGSLAAALTAAEGRGVTHIIVCNGTYHDRWSLTDGDGGVRIHGGFTCPGETTPWTPTPGTVPSVAPTAIGEALRLDGVSDVVIEDMAFAAPSANAAGGSSVGALATSSTNVVLRRVAITAGDGMDGVDGGLVPFTEFPDAATLQGNPASSNSGGDLKEADACGVCPGGGTTRGGSGGDGGPGPTDGGPGLPSDLGGGAAGTVEGCLASNTGGGNGAPGVSPLNPSSPASAGQLVGTAWQTTSGENGVPGGRGQGGGGGAGSASGGGGGGGGCGACGGAGGPGGTGGGASIGIIVVQSTLTLEGGSITTGTAGDGGDGAAGQLGQSTGGTGGNRADNGCNGGNGGPGGSGSAGSGGSGGSVFGVIHSGTAPAVSDTTVISLGTEGQAGVGGAQGQNDGLAGLASDVFASGN